MSKMTIAVLACSLAVSTIGLSGCLGPPEQAAPSDEPQEWLSQFDPEDDRCTDIEETFHNQGERYLGIGRVTDDGLLAEMVLSRYLPGGRTSDNVHVAASERTNAVKAVLAGITTTEVSFPIHCEFGWFVLKTTRSGTYLGEGVDEKSYEKLAFFRVGNDGHLIAKVMENAKFTTYYLFHSSASAVRWYRFRPLTNSSG